MLGREKYGRHLGVVNREQQQQQKQDAGLLFSVFLLKSEDHPQ